jgi:transposase
LQVDFGLVDKGYDGARAMEAIAAARATPVVPRRFTTASWRAFDAHLYKERNAVERFFSKIKCILTLGKSLINLEQHIQAAL